MKQQNLFSLPKMPKEFGGSLAKSGKRKTARSLNLKLPTHLVLRADSSALLKKFILIEHLIVKYANKFNIKIYRKATCSNHIHMLIKMLSREDYKKFIRALSGAIAKTLWKPLMQLLISHENLSGRGRLFFDPLIATFPLLLNLRIK